jgi:hypothetical protein
MSTELAETQLIERAVEVVGNRLVTIEDRGAAYALLYAIQLRINRALRKAKDDLIVHLESNGLKAMGPLSIKATAIDVAWPVNSEGNWGDAGTQEELEAYRKVAPDFIRHVPEHYEIRTAELGAAVHAGDPVARQLHTIAKERGWRTEEGRRLSLAVSEAKPPREKAA